MTAINRPESGPIIHTSMVHDPDNLEWDFSYIEALGVRPDRIISYNIKVMLLPIPEMKGHYYKLIYTNRYGETIYCDVPLDEVFPLTLYNYLVNFVHKLR